mmetsp:Transcript_15988/g.64496  ORF Transcript_15988/g.64496 Transcript_15988/m.64496 type:complete len:276 (+) Transcript_15988:1937-2764(+)
MMKGGSSPPLLLAVVVRRPVVVQKSSRRRRGQLGRLAAPPGAPRRRGAREARRWRPRGGSPACRSRRRAAAAWRRSGCPWTRIHHPASSSSSSSRSADPPSSSSSSSSAASLIVYETSFQSTRCFVRACAPPSSSADGGTMRTVSASIIDTASSLAIDPLVAPLSAAESGTPWSATARTYVWFGLKVDAFFALSTSVGSRKSTPTPKPTFFGRNRSSEAEASISALMSPKSVFLRSSLDDCCFLSSLTAVSCTVLSSAPTFIAARHAARTATRIS